MRAMFRGGRAPRVLRLAPSPNVLEWFLARRLHAVDGCGEAPHPARQGACGPHLQVGRAFLFGGHDCLKNVAASFNLRPTDAARD